MQPIQHSTQNPTFLPPEQKNGLVQKIQRYIKNPKSKNSLIVSGISSLIVFTLVILIAFPKTATPIPTNTTPQAVTIRVWTYTDTISHYQKLLDDYHTANPYITIKFEQRTADDYDATLNQKLKTDPTVVADIFEINSKDIPLYQSILAPAPPTTYSGIEFAANYYTQQTKENVLGSSVYGIPTGADGLMLAYNTKYVKTNEIPQFWPQFIVYQATKIHQSTTDSNINDVNGMAVNHDAKTKYLDEIAELLLYQNDQKGFLEGSAILDDKHSTASLNTYIKLLNTKPWDEKDADSISAFAKGNTAFAIIKAKDINFIKQTNPNLDFKTAVVPIFSDQVYLSSSTSFVVNNYSSNTSESWKLAKALTSESAEKYLFNNAADFQVPQKPYALKSLATDLNNSPLLAPIGTMLPNMVGWTTPDRSKSSLLFQDLLSNTQEYVSSDISSFNDKLASIVASFP